MSCRMSTHLSMQFVMSVATDHSRSICYGNISDNEVFKGDFKKALGAIKAKAYVMPGQTDLYFPPEDSEFEVANMPNAKFIPIPSIWGHFAGGPGTNPDDVKFLDNKVKELLAG